MTQSKTPETQIEWNILIDGLVVLPQPITKEDIEKHIQSLGYDPSAVVNLMIEFAQAFRALGAMVENIPTDKEAVDDADRQTCS